MAETLMDPSVSFYADVERVIEKHPYDPSRAHQLLEQAGLTRGPDGVYRS